MAPRPWTFEDSDEYHIRDANGNSIMSDTSYYPWVPEREDAKLIVNAVNSYDLYRDLIFRMTEHLTDIYDRDIQVDTKLIQEARMAILGVDGYDVGVE